jgi:hypothetical protein
MITMITTSTAKPPPPIISCFFVGLGKLATGDVPGAGVGRVGGIPIDRSGAPLDVTTGLLASADVVL